MNRHLLIFICLLNIVGCSQKPADNNTSPQPKQLKDISLDPATFGDNWEKSYGIVLDSWDDMSNLPVEAQMTVKPLRSQMEPMGIIALADFSCVRKVFPLNAITVRVFKFKNSELASAWAEKKYKYSGWEQHYNLVENLSYFAVDSTQLKKRCIISDEYWITSHHLGDSDLHIKALEVIMKELGLP
jgi:hypothetical protein